jgi:fatty-acyl-CoA synthase
MTVNTMIKGDTATAVVTGRIDVESSIELGSALASIDKDMKLVLDFADVEYITSSGLRVLLVEKKKHAANSMTIINVSDVVAEVFTITGFDSVLDYTMAEEQASDYLKLSFKDFIATKSKKKHDRVALIATDGTPEGRRAYTYEEIDRYSSIIAMDLEKQGIKKGTHVGLMGANSVNWVFTFFAIQKLGGLAFFVNFNLNEEETENIIEVGDITHLCMGDTPAISEQKAFAEKIQNNPDCSVTNVYFFGSNLDISARAGETYGEWKTYVNNDDAAVVIFTSGSTGKPKAVMLSAYNIIKSANVLTDCSNITSDDIYCQVLPMFHVFGIYGLIGNMVTDAPVVIPVNIKTATVIHTIAAEKCTLLYSIPTLLFAISASKIFEPDLVSSIKCVFIAGAGVAVAQLKNLKKSFQNAVFMAAYGQSEMAPITITPYDDTDEHVAKSIGLPAENFEVRIVNVETGEDCPQGESGELLSKGYNTMVGYYRLDPEDQPFDDDGWLHTGDLAVVASDGYISLVGRAKEMIKKGGENISPVEVAEMVTQFPDVDDVKVVGIADDFYTEVVGVAVVMKNGVQIDKDALIHFLSGKLAKYKVPTYVFQYDTFPKLANGKVDAVTLKKEMNEKALQLTK